MGTFQTPSETGENPDSAQNFRRNYPEKTSANNVRRNTESLGGARFQGIAHAKLSIGPWLFKTFVRSRVSRRHLDPKRSLAVMPRPEGLQVQLMGCNRRPRADLFSQRAQAAQGAGRVRVGFGRGPVHNRVQQRPMYDRPRYRLHLIK